MANLAEATELRTSIVQAESIAPLVSVAIGVLAEQPSAEARRQAASALSTLALDNVDNAAEPNRAAVASELVRALKLANAAETRELTVSLLRDLCADCDTAETRAYKANRAALAKAGAVSALVAQLTAAERVQALATDVLSLLARTSCELHAEVTQSLIQMLRNDDKRIRQKAGVALSKVGA